MRTAKTLSSLSLVVSRDAGLWIMHLRLSRWRFPQSTGTALLTIAGDSHASEA